MQILLLGRKIDIGTVTWGSTVEIECRRQDARIKVQREVGKGFGLVAMEGVKRGK
jgi:hypothetical protein